MCAVYVRPDSPFYWLLLDGYTDPNGNPRREPTPIRVDAPLVTQRKENRALAEQRYHARMTELARQSVTGVHASITFADHLDWWIAHKLPQRRGRDREREILPRLRAGFGRTALASIDRHLVSEWITTRLATPTIVTMGTRGRTRTFRATPSTVNREVALLKKILQDAVPKYLDASPLFGMPLLRKTTPKRRVLTEDEEARLRAVMTPADRAFFLIGLDGLVRLGDILDLRWRDDHGDRLWIADPKAGGGFYVPLSSRARRALNAIKPTRAAGDAFIFAARRRARTERDRRGAIRLALKRYCQRAHVPYGRSRGGITFHWATRRTGLTRMLTRQVDIGTAQKIGRWKTADVVLEAYHELIDEHARAAVETIGARDSSVNQNAHKRGQSHAVRGTRDRRIQS